jgi:hypothetical protein
MRNIVNVDDDADVGGQRSAHLNPFPAEMRLVASASETRNTSVSSVGAVRPPLVKAHVVTSHTRERR